jgi:hypothetical protein
MTRIVHMSVVGIGVAVMALLWNGEIPRGARDGLTSTAQAVVGRPATPVSYAGVARRTTVGVATPGVGGGVGALPGAGAGQAGVGYSAGVGMNLGGPVNRVGVR